MKKVIIFLSSIVVSLVLVTKVYAICPVCTVAVGAGVGLARWLGIDDTITGLWVGGFIVSLIMWTISYLERRNINFFARNLVIIVAYYALTIVPIYFIKTIWHPHNTLGGVNKLLLGIIIGSILFYLGAIWYYYLKKKNNGHAYFPFQKVVMPIAPLIIMSIIFYFITRK
jgi:NADH:ubiquinone oxidoreductase subunit 4 (subunit M)